MKSEDLRQIDDLVVAKIHDLLLQQGKVSGEAPRSEILAAAAFLDDAGINELFFALRRIEKGTYGQCVICRHDIPMDVLKKNLTARFCPSCETAMREKGDRVK